jgi:molybdate transport system permease protein
MSDSALPSQRPGRMATVVATAALSFLAFPVVALLARALDAGVLASALTDPAVIEALVLSLVTTTISLGIVVVLGLPLGLVLARTHFRGKAVAEALVDLPIVLPPSVAGLALLFAFGRNGIAGESLELVGIVVPFTVVAVMMAQVFVSMPFFVRAARAGFRSVDAEVEEAARVDGADEGAVMRRVTVPLAAPAIGAGLVLAWARALGEFGATILFAGNIEGRTQTLPLLVYSEFQSSLGAATAAASILVLAAMGVLVAVRALRWPSGLSWSG